MLKAILARFTGNASEPANAHSVEVATAALLYEVIRADNEVDHSEQAMLSAMLKDIFSLSDEEVMLVQASGSKRSEEAVDLVQFTQVLNQTLNEADKQQVIQGLWNVAYADNELAPLEEHIIRKIADLLYIPHSKYIHAKLTAQSAG
ncbi:TerB family tellurite resistance protein [Aestuariibacter sp. GS-14]|uniref:tellurite resistance TerB family protein n=1 Tax=Alteromonadaceae TaxID=72275 RepID=UPI0011270E63|nr:TerB family tellurite resistance protein [Aestuariibacter sp. GS-14]TPV61718.1 TerB family tellurite resistance protein [Aestuariibacter sp. GS-14]